MAFIGAGASAIFITASQVPSSFLSRACSGPGLGVGGCSWATVRAVNQSRTSASGTMRVMAKAPETGEDEETDPYPSVQRLRRQLPTTAKPRPLIAVT